MADYYPLIARAIAGLDPSAPGESRRALYERARSALIAQLRGVEPPLSESEITRERLSLEEAVRKVESEAAARARDLSRPDPGGRGRAGDAFRAGNRVGPKPGEAAPATETSASQPPAQPPARARQPIVPTPPPVRTERAPPGQDDRGDQRPPRNLRADPRQPTVGMQDPTLPTRERNNGPRRGEADRPPPPPPPPGIRGFRDVTADADDLGRATAQASRAARKTYANVPTQSGEFDRLEPSMEDRGGGEPGGPYSYDESAEEAARYQLPAARPRPTPDKDEKRSAVHLGGGFPFKSAIAIGVVLILAGAAILWGPKLVSGVRGLFTPSAPQVEAPKDASLAPRPKIADRVGQPSSSDQIAPVAQRVVLYDEDPAEPKGKQYVGTVVWRTEQIKGTAAQPGDLAVRADIDIPDRKFKMTMSFRRNTDTSLPASHTAELTFILPPDFVGGGVANVPGILMKSNEQARGTPLAGLAVKVTDGFFLVGLSNVETDRARNLQLLKERSWFDVPLVYSNQRRAIIAIEKGSPGERAFNDAFAAWGE
jgi:hypothetical protein